MARDAFLAGGVRTSHGRYGGSSGTSKVVLAVAPESMTARDLAQHIASRPAVAQQLVKELVQTAFESPLHAGLQAERAAFAAALSSEDAREGLSAFLEKRKPIYRHR